MKSKRWIAFLGAIALVASLPLATLAQAAGDVPVVSVLADYEDDSVAVSIGRAKNLLPADCSTRLSVIPARGQRALSVTIGATQPNVSVDVDLVFRVPTRFAQADAIATWCWLNEGEVDLSLRLRDAAGGSFETRPQHVRAGRRWERLDWKLGGNDLRRLDAPVAEEAEARAASPVWPISVEGYRLAVADRGRQEVFLDDLEVSQRVPPNESLRGDFRFTMPTKIFSPGSDVRVAVQLENMSRKAPAPLAIKLNWMRPDGSVLASQVGSVNLPPSGDDFRSRQSFDFRQSLREPGLYRLVCEARANNWLEAARFETTVAVAQSNSALSRGRSAFFGVRSNLVREPVVDQQVEIAVAREIGAQVLAIELPWRLLEPRPDRFEYAFADPLVDAITKRDMAPLLVLTEPPVWLGLDASERLTRQTSLLRALIGRYGDRVRLFQFGADTFATPPTECVAAVEALQKVLNERDNGARLLSPPIAVDASDAPCVRLPEYTHDEDAPAPYWSFETTGDSDAALAALRTYAQRCGFTWGPQHWWIHRQEALTDAGRLADGVSVLRHYVEAAAEGVAGVIWFDLRDDGNRPDVPDDWRGLVRRDFSPKTTLPGYMTAVGELGGLQYAGPVGGAPDAIDSALFIGSGRQVAVVLPKPHRVMPAVLAPVKGVPGEITVVDFERRRQPLLDAVGPPLIAMEARPLIVTLAITTAQPLPQLAFGPSWIAAPRSAFVGPAARPLHVELTAPTALKRSYLKLEAPKNAPVASSLSTRSLNGDAGARFDFDITLTPTDGLAFDECGLKLRASIEGAAIDVPVFAKPLVALPPLRGAGILDAGNRVGDLRPPAGTPVFGDWPLHVAWRPDGLIIALPIAALATAADQARIAIGLAESPAFVSGVIRDLPSTPKLTPRDSVAAGSAMTWQVESKRGGPGGRTWLIVTLPAKSLGLERLEDGQRLLMAVEYAQTGFGPAPTVNRWGDLSGLTPVSDAFRWIELSSEK